MRFHIKINILLFLLFLCILWYLWKVPFTEDINKNITALQIDGVTNTEQDVEIDIRGTYETYLFGDDEFKGYLSIEGYGITKERCHIRIDQYPYKSAILEYIKISENHMETHPFGLIYADSKFKSFVILPMSEYLEHPDYNGTGGSIDMSDSSFTAFCYPIEDRTEGVKLVSKMIGRGSIR